MKKRKFKTIRWYIIAPVILIILVLTYVHLFYKPGSVNKGYAKYISSFQKHKHIVTSVRFTHDDSLMVTSGVDSTIKIWNRTTGNIIREMKLPTGIAYMDLSQDGKMIAAGGYDSKLRIYNSDGLILKEITGHEGVIWTVAFSADGKQVASSGDDATILIHDVNSGAILHQLKDHKRIVWSVKFSPDGKYLAAGSFDFTMKLWDLQSGAMIWNNTGHDETVVDLAFSHDGNLLATTSDDKTVKFWDWKNKTLVRTLKVKEHVQAVAFSPDDKLIVAGGRDKTLLGELVQNFMGDSEFNKGVSARLWEVRTGKLLHTFTHHKNDVMDLAFSSNGKFIASASADRTVDLWEVTYNGSDK